MNTSSRQPENFQDPVSSSRDLVCLLRQRRGYNYLSLSTVPGYRLEPRGRIISKHAETKARGENDASCAWYFEATDAIREHLVHWRHPRRISGNVGSPTCTSHGTNAPENPGPFFTWCIYAVRRTFQCLPPSKCPIHTG